MFGQLFQYKIEREVMKMARVKYLVYVQPVVAIGLEDLIKNKIVSYYEEGGKKIVAAKGVNKTTLKKLLQKEVSK